MQLLCKYIMLLIKVYSIMHFPQNINNPIMAKKYFLCYCEHEKKNQCNIFFFF